MADASQALAALERYWGYREFRPQQAEIVESILRGYDVAAVLPTGGGKSLCYQLPAVVSGTLCVVVSPLIALMEDQAAQLAEIGIPAGALTSAADWAEQKATLAAARQGRLRLLYLSPERVAKEGTRAILRECPVGYFAIDEAHCISEWGHEFRPEYRQLARLRDEFPGRAIAAFTGSATRRVRADIVEQLRLENPRKFIRSFFRPNLRYTLRQVANEAEQRRLLREVLEVHSSEPVIIYDGTIAGVESTAEWLNSSGISAERYHGKMKPEDRRRAQERWMDEEAPVMVGTMAFGLGINKPGVRAVVHLTLPGSLEQHYQEAGRAGRDGDPAECVLLWRKKDLALKAHFIGEIQDGTERERAWQRYHQMKEFAGEQTCRHRRFSEYFGEIWRRENCGACDACGYVAEWISSPPEPSALKQKLRESRRATRAETRTGTLGRDGSEASPHLVEAMKAWRREYAKSRGLPAYVVLHDASLVDLCRRRPASLQELTEVYGIGQAKAANMGQDLLAALRNASR